MRPTFYTLEDTFVFGSSGNDIIWANIGNDQIFGESGDDLIHGGLGSDTYITGLGADTIIEVGDVGALLAGFQIPTPDFNTAQLPNGMTLAVPDESKSS